jgi:hypothetical protein
MTTPIPQRINSEYIDISTAADKKKYLPLSRRQIARMCEQGVFKTAFKPGVGAANSKWVILRSEVLAHKYNNHSQPQYQPN